MILMPPRFHEITLFPLLKKCREMEIHGMYNKNNWHFRLTLFCNYHHFALFYHFLVRQKRMLNPCHEVNKLLHYGNKHSRLFNKGERFI